MGSEHRGDEDLVRAVATGLADDVLSEDYPLVDVEAELREAGANPEAIGRWGRALVQDLARNRRLAWQSEAGKARDAMQAKLAARITVAHLPRAELLARIDAARRDSRLSGPVSVAARNLTSTTSDEELRQVLEDLEALALLADENGTDGGGKV